MTQLQRFAPDVLAFFAHDRDWAKARIVEEGRMYLEVDGAKCPTPREFVTELALAVRYPRSDLSLNILGQELSNLDWLGAKRFGICITHGEQLFARGNDYMWQYLLEMAWNIQTNVEQFDRPSISWLVQMEADKGKALQAFFEAELGFEVSWL